MTLGSAVLFPQAMMPLYIFESRYQTMLGDVLEGDRIFAVAALDDNREDGGVLEIPHAVGGVGVVRACRRNDDGTANLILEGLARVAFEGIVSEEPYRRIRIRQLPSEPGASADALAFKRTEVLRLIQAQIRLGAEIPDELATFLDNVGDPESVLDLAIYSLCGSAPLKQELLETRGVMDRFKRFEGFLREEIERLKMEQQLRGELGEDDIGDN